VVAHASEASKDGGLFVVHEDEGSGLEAVILAVVDAPVESLVVLAWIVHPCSLK
jgi:hypothetical protein